MSSGTRKSDGGKSTEKRRHGVLPQRALTRTEGSGSAAEERELELMRMEGEQEEMAPERSSSLMYSSISDESNFNVKIMYT
jgi:hypothetical protein